MEKKNGRPKENYIWHGHEGFTKAEVIILQKLEQNKTGYKIKQLAQITGYHPVSISHLLNHLASRNLVIKNMYGYWKLRKDIKERITLEISQSFKEDLEIKAIKEGKSIEDYIIQKLEETLY